MHKLLVAGGGGHEKTLPVAGGEAPHHTAPADGRGDDGDVAAELGFEGVTELVAAVGRDDAVAVGESGEYADVVAVFVLYADRHDVFLFRCVCVVVFVSVLCNKKIVYFKTNCEVSKFYIYFYFYYNFIYVVIFFIYIIYYNFWLD